MILYFCLFYMQQYVSLFLVQIFFILWLFYLLYLSFYHNKKILISFSILVPTVFFSSILFFSFYAHSFSVGVISENVTSKILPTQIAHDADLFYSGATVLVIKETQEWKKIFAPNVCGWVPATVVH